MNTFFDRIACAVIRQPSINRCGTRAMISRSLNVPGSDSSAFTVRYVGFGESAGMKPALRPVAKNAPPRPRSPDALSSSTICAGSIVRARAICAYPPTARYSSSFVRSRSSAPARTTIGRSAVATAHLSDDPRHVVRGHVLPVAMIDRDDRRPAATAEALDHPKRDLAVVGRLARANAELGFERLQDALCSEQPAADVRAHLDHVPTDGLQLEHVVEARDRLAVGRCVPERLAHLAKRLGREPAAVALLRD